MKNGGKTRKMTLLICVIKHNNNKVELISVPEIIISLNTGQHLLAQTTEIGAPFFYGCFSLGQMYYPILIDTLY